MPGFDEHKRGRKPPHWRKRKRRHWGLRRRLTFMFAFVALTAVSLTIWLTLGAVFEAQRDLFEQPQLQTTNPVPDQSFRGRYKNDPAFAQARDAFRRITRTAFFAALLSFVLASIVAAIATRFLTRPLNALTAGAQRLEAGERNVQLRVPQSKDELRTLTEAFNALSASLAKQEAYRQHMVADIAHDLRTPLAVLQGEIEGMQDNLIDVDDAALARLHHEVQLLTRLVNNLRTLATAEGATFILDKQVVTLAVFLKQVIASFGLHAADMNMQLTLAPVSPSLTVLADPVQLNRIMTNLLDNALRYATRDDRQGKVDVHVSQQDQTLCIHVSDDGPGIKPEELEQVFERFYRGAQSAVSRKEGTGLGLTIARAIAEAHGGTLTARNKPQGGAEFLLCLPQE